MQKHRFLASKITNGGYAFVEGREAIHGRKVLRLKAGDQIIIFDLDGNEYKAEMLRYHSKEKFEAKLLEEIVRDVEMEVSVHLVMGLCRSKNFELALQKCTELGVKSFIPLETDHSILKKDNAANKLARWDEIVLDACKQSGRTAIPEISAPQDLESLFSNLEITEKNSIVAALSENSRDLGSIITKLKSDNEKDLFIFIGPEGGFSDKEKQLFQDKNLNMADLGNRVLRAETAAIFVSSIISYEFD